MLYETVNGVNVN